MKKTKMILGLAAVSLLALQGPIALGASTGTNNVDIDFMINEDPTKPVDPKDPDPEKPVEPADPGDGNETGNKGPLSIDYLTNFKFGSDNKISGSKSVFKALNSKIRYVGSTEVMEVQNYVQVTDNRGTGSGWGLTVEQKSPLSNGTASIEKTELRLLNGTMKSEHTEGAPTANKLIKITPGGAAQAVTNAGDSQGIGTWVTAFGNDVTEGMESIELEIAGNQKIPKGSYSTTLTWTLTDTPSN